MQFNTVLMIIWPLVSYLGIPWLASHTARVPGTIVANLKSCPGSVMAVSWLYLGSMLVVVLVLILFFTVI